MGRAPRVDVGNLIYHIISRANGRRTIFNTVDAYVHFEMLLKQAVERFDMRLLAYVLMPNHRHLIFRAWINQADRPDDLHDLRVATENGKPFGIIVWTERMIERFGLETTTRGRGRSKKGT